MKVQHLYIDYLGPTFNKYNTMFKWQKGKEREECEKAVKEAIEKYDIKSIKYPIKIIFQPIIGSRVLKGKKNTQRAYDIINYANTVKMIEDRLVKEKIIENDSNAFVYSHTIKKPIKALDQALTGFLVIIEEDTDFQKMTAVKLFKKFTMQVD